MEANNLIVIFTAGLPGIGKSSLISHLQKLNDEEEGSLMKVLTSDYVRVKSKERFKELNDTSQMDEYEVETQSKGLYDEILELTVRDAFLELKTARKGVFLLDKNHVPDSTRDLIIEEARVQNPNPLIIHIVPS